MHVIDKCPWCGRDFMYHMTDYHLLRNSKIDGPIRICHHCHERDMVQIAIVKAMSEIRPNWQFTEDDASELLDKLWAEPEGWTVVTKDDAETINNFGIDPAKPGGDETVCMTTEVDHE